MEITVGTVVRLRVPCLGNKMGTIGVGINDYGDGCQVIFPNGEYDGFSEEEQHEFLDVIGTETSVSGYRFQNVMKLSDDYRRGLFDKAFEFKETLF